MNLPFTTFETPLGTMIAAASEAGVRLLEFLDEPLSERERARIRRRIGAELVPGASPWFPRIEHELGEYFAGTRQEFTVPLDPCGTDFQKRAWEALLEIPYGETRSYREQASRVGNPRAVRAVAGANRENRIAILIPCHRVIGADGALVGYAAGMWRKQRLLDLERRGLIAR